MLFFIKELHTNSNKKIFFTFTVRKNKNNC